MIIKLSQLLCIFLFEQRLIKWRFLGVWKIIQDQEVYFLKTFEIAIRKMNKKLKYVSDIMFSYFRQQKCGGVGNGDYLGG